MTDRAGPVPAERVAIGIMARAPSDDRGKTRLLAALGLTSGVELRRAILLDTLDSVRQATGADRVMLFTPPTAANELASLAGPPFSVLPQRGDDLGERLERAFADLFGQGYAAVAIVGSDLPTLPPDFLERAIGALRQGVDPLVLGPASDGGYYLVGLRQLHPELFRGIAWSTDHVLAATLDAARHRELSVTLLPEWYDLDSVADLRRALAPDAIAHVARNLADWAARNRLSLPGD